MIKNKLIRHFALFVSVIMLFTSAVNTTYGFIVTKTNSLINTFVPFSSAKNSLFIHKTVEHPLGQDYIIPDNISFDFKVELGALYANTTIKTSDGEVTADNSGTAYVAVKPGKTLEIEKIDVGTKATVTEIQKSGNGFTVKDKAVKEATVSNNGGAKVDFVNVYAPLSVKPVNVSINGLKLLEGRNWQSGDAFTFKLEQKNENGIWESLGTKTVSYDAQNRDFNKFSFSDIVSALEFNKVGTYKFRITEVIGTLDNMDYDKSVNTFSIKVTDADMDGKLEIGDVSVGQNAVASKENGSYSVLVTFNNTFVPAVPDPDDIAVDIMIEKTVKNTGELSIGPEGFEFVLEDTLNGEKITLQTGDKGTAIFKLPFTAADIGKTYTYKLYENNNGINGVTYDTDIYNISISITLGQDNKLLAAITMNEKTVDTAIAEFENVYYAVTPPTSDNNNISFWIILMIVSATCCIFLIVLDRKYKCKEIKKGEK